MNIDLNAITDIMQSIAILALAGCSYYAFSSVRNMRRVLLAAKDAEIARLLDDNRVLKAMLERAKP